MMLQGGVLTTPELPNTQLLWKGTRKLQLSDKHIVAVLFLGMQPFPVIKLPNRENEKHPKIFIYQSANTDICREEEKV